MADMSTHLHIDPFSGIAGDMFLGAAIDLGAPLSGILKALESVKIKPKYNVTFDRVQRHGIGAVDLKVVTGESGHSHDHGHNHGEGHHHHHHDVR